MKCEHSTTIVNFIVTGIMSVETCTWGCDQTLISIIQPNGTTVTKTPQEWLELEKEIQDMRDESEDRAWERDLID